MFCIFLPHEDISWEPSFEGSHCDKHRNLYERARTPCLVIFPLLAPLVQHSAVFRAFSSKLPLVAKAIAMLSCYHMSCFNSIICHLLSLMLILGTCWTTRWNPYMSSFQRGSKINKNNLGLKRSRTNFRKKTRVIFFSESQTSAGNLWNLSSAYVDPWDILNNFCFQV